MTTRRDYVMDIFRSSTGDDPCKWNASCSNLPYCYSDLVLIKQQYDLFDSSELEELILYLFSCTKGTYSRDSSDETVHCPTTHTLINATGKILQFKKTHADVRFLKHC